MPILEAVLFSEFDNEAGPRVVYQAPDGYLSHADFDAVSDYVVVRSDLCGRVVTVVHPTATPHVEGGAAAPRALTIMSYPVGLRHEKYQRNSLLFSVSFVLAAGADTAPFAPVLRKLGLCLYSMEVEGEFVSDPRRRRRLRSVLPAILRGLRQQGECFVSVDGVDTIALSLLPTVMAAPAAAAPRPRGAHPPAPSSHAGPLSLPIPPPAAGGGTACRAVADHDVPVPVRDLDALAAGCVGSPDGDDDESAWDLCLRQVAPHIDGVAYARAIAEAADVEPALVRSALRQLVAAGVVALVDVFAYSNIYASTPRLQLLLRDARLRHACLAFIAADVEAAEGGGPQPQQQLVRSAPRRVPTFDAAFRLLAAFGAGARTSDVCAHGDTAGAGVHDRRLVVWGVLHGVLRRVHRYPVPTSLGSDAGRDARVLAALRAQMAAAGHRAWAPDAGAPSPLFDGSRHVEELCVALCVPQSALEGAVAACGAFTFVQR